MLKLIPIAFLSIACLTSQAIADKSTAPSIKMTDAAGNEVTLPSKQPGVDIYLFWATWCPYCKALMPHLQNIQNEYGDAVRIYALQIRDDQDPRPSMQEHGYDFVLLPHADETMALYGVRSTPAVFLVDEDGSIRFNLYEMIFNDSAEFKAQRHGQKAAQRAPYWSAEIRRIIDQVLEEDKTE